MPQLPDEGTLFPPPSPPPSSSSPSLDTSSDGGKHPFAVSTEFPAPPLRQGAGLIGWGWWERGEKYVPPFRVEQYKPFNRGAKGGRDPSWPGRGPHWLSDSAR